MYVTDKLGVGAFLMARGYKHLGLQPINDSRRPGGMVFTFDMDEAEGQSLCRQFYANAMVNAYAFDQALVQLKIALQEKKGGYSRPRQVLTPNYFSNGGVR